MPASIVRVAWGAVLVAFPGSVLRRCPRTPQTRAASSVVRLLGARQLVQGLVANPRSRHAAWQGVPDALHAASMAGLALRSDRWRTAALADAVIASLFAVSALRGRDRRGGRADAGG
ncbi:hypothetical protein [Streptomyces naganishii]|uniref:Uncharacterized protein n=1 Tax=Streptomyces naganishii JCM 4654 TaxID=1306179 RepID=A0A918Y252_9ACTN|nr:hypothetical protein [Streptomyces naganishii]GHD87233.1 hypothetical protein GCM10010508_18550 [Streptomyces naganishii JCM 4654]